MRVPASFARIVRSSRSSTASPALNDEYLAKNMQLVRLYGLMNPAFGLLAGLGAVTVLGVGGTLAVRGTISVGAFVAFGLYLGMLTWPLIALGWVVNLFQRGAASDGATRSRSSTRRPRLATRRHPTSLPAATTGRSVEFRGVGFHYPPPADAQPRWVLRDISFRVRAGATLAVVGATGSGKSALLELLASRLRSAGGQILDRRRTGDVAHARRASPRDRVRATGEPPVQRDDPREPDVRHRRRIARAMGGWCRAARFDDRRISWRLRHDARRTRNQPLGRPETACRACARPRAPPSIVVLDDALSAVDTHTEADILRGLRERPEGPHRDHRVPSRERRARCELDHRAR